MLALYFFIPKTTSAIDKLGVLCYNKNSDCERVLFNTKGGDDMAIIAKVQGQKREPESVARRTDFEYMGGHGTFYRMPKEYFEENRQKLFGAKRGDHLELVLYNLHTEQLDEVALELLESFDLSDRTHIFIGKMIDAQNYWEIKLDWYYMNPINTNILVYASAQPLI